MNYSVIAEVQDCF